MSGPATPVTRVSRTLADRPPRRSGATARSPSAGQWRTVPGSARPRVPEAQGLIRQQGSRQHARARSGRPLGTCPRLRGSELPRVRISCQPHDAQPGRLAFRSCEGEAPSLAAGHGGPAASPTSDLQWSATRWSLTGEGSGEVPMATYAAEQPATRGRRPTVSVSVPIVASKITAPGWAVPRARITTLIARGRRWCQLTVVTAPASPGDSMSSAPAAGGEPVIGPSRRLPAALVTRCRHRLLPSVKALRGAAAASRSEHP